MTDNPADLLTRVRTIDEFKQQFNFWIPGPPFRQRRRQLAAGTRSQGE
jgi:hypothetical protein